MFENKSKLFIFQAGNQMNANANINESKKKGRPVYLDYQATTPLAPEALAAMQPWLGGPDSPGGWANPHSAHAMGRKASAAVEVARSQIDALMPPGGRVIFTSGATEALNLAIRGALPALAPRKRIVTIATEHAAVRDTCLWLEKQGHDVVLLPVDREGLVDMDAARAAITPDTALVAAMLVNNEIGVIQVSSNIHALPSSNNLTTQLISCRGITVW
jgi:cysteine desulfurase